MFTWLTRGKVTRSSAFASGVALVAPSVVIANLVQGGDGLRGASWLIWLLLIIVVFGTVVGFVVRSLTRSQ